MYNFVFYELSKTHLVPSICEQPFVNWDSNVYSTRLYRTRTIIFRTAKLYTDPIKISIESGQNIVRLFDDRENESTHLFTDIEIRDNLGWYMFTFVYKCETEGEFVFECTIDNSVYKFGVRFEDLDEKLLINLANRGFDVSNEISKAFYEGDIHEVTPDVHLLNKKYRELLSNYFDVVNNKGNYESLSKALEWFGYGECVQLKEVWSYETPDGTKFFDVSQNENIELTCLCEKEFANVYKTLNYVLKQPQSVWDNTSGAWKDFQYDVDETNQLACIWTENEMRVKLFLLRTFLQEYFMPIHTLISQSNVEKLIIALNSSFIRAIVECKYKEIHNFNNLDVTLNSHQLDTSVSNNLENDLCCRSNINLRMDEVSVCSGLPVTGEPYKTAFTNKHSITIGEGANQTTIIPILSCHSVFDENLNIDDVNFNQIIKILSHQFYRGYGAVLSCTFEAPYKLVSGTCTKIWLKPNNEIRTIEGNFDFTSDLTKSRNKFTTEFLFDDVGQYELQFDLIDEKNNLYTKKIAVSVVSHLTPSLDFKILKTKYREYDTIPNPYEVSNPNVDLYTMLYNHSTIKLSDSYVKYIPFTTKGGISSDAPSSIVEYIVKLLPNQDKNSPEYNKHIRVDVAESVKTLLQQYNQGDGDFENMCYIKHSHSEIVEFEGNSCYNYFQFHIIPKYKGKSIDFNKLISDIQDFVVDTNKKLHSLAHIDGWQRDLFLPELCELANVPEELTQEFPIVCIPIVKRSIKDPITGTITNKKQFIKYAYPNLQTPAWKLKSWQTNSYVEIESDGLQQNILGNDTKEGIPTGYYDVEFTFKPTPLANAIIIKQQLPTKIV